MRALLLVALFMSVSVGASPVYDTSCEAQTTGGVPTVAGHYVVVRVNERAAQVWQEENGVSGLQRTFCIDKVTGTFYDADARLDPAP